MQKYVPGLFKSIAKTFVRKTQNTRVGAAVTGILNENETGRYKKK